MREPWYNLEPCWKEGKLFNFILSMRGPGKTYAAKKKAIELFLHDGTQFIYLRRYKREVNTASFFADVSQEFPDVALEVKKGGFWINGALAGVPIALSTALTKKSVNFNRTGLIIFDEFLLPAKTNYRYLSGDVKQFLDFYETVNRLRIDGRAEVRVLFLANTFTMYNPYFNYFHIRFKNGQRVYKRDDIWAEIYGSTEFKELKLQSRFGRLVADTEYGDYAIDGQFIEDSPKFVEKRTPRSDYYCTFWVGGSPYGVWIDWKAGKIFISEQANTQNYYQYALTTEDHDVNTLLVTSRKKNYNLMVVTDNYKIGNVRFETQKVKNAVEDALLYFC